MKFLHKFKAVESHISNREQNWQPDYVYWRKRQSGLETRPVSLFHRYLLWNSRYILVLSFMADDQRYLAILLSRDWEAQNSDGKEDRLEVVLIDLFSGDPIGTDVLLGLLQTRWNCQWTELELLAIHFTCRIRNSFNSSISTSQWPSLEQDKMSSKLYVFIVFNGFFSSFGWISH